MCGRSEKISGIDNRELSRANCTKFKILQVSPIYLVSQIYLFLTNFWDRQQLQEPIAPNSKSHKSHKSIRSYISHKFNKSHRYVMNLTSLTLFNCLFVTFVRLVRLVRFVRLMIFWIWCNWLLQLQAGVQLSSKTSSFLNPLPSFPSPPTNYSYELHLNMYLLHMHKS